MDINSLIYFTEAAKDLNFTQTAKRLFISQQNLSNHIARLEEYYGILLFERKPKVALTYAGEVLLAYANRFRLDDDNMRMLLSDIKQKEKGILRIGGSLLRTGIILPILADRFSEKYSNVELHFYYHHSETLEKMMLDGDLDFSICINTQAHLNLTSSVLFHDHLYIIVSDELLRRYVVDDIDAFIDRANQGADINEFAMMPFLNIRSSHIIENCFLSAGCTPNFTVTSNFPYFMMSTSYYKTTAAIMTEAIYLTIKSSIPDSIHVFPLKTTDDFAPRDISFIRHKRKYLSQYGQYFLKITEDYFDELNNQH